MKRAHIYFDEWINEHLDNVSDVLRISKSNTIRLYLSYAILGFALDEGYKISFNQFAEIKRSIKKGDLKKFEKQMLFEARKAAEWRFIHDKNYRIKSHKIAA